MKLFLMNINYKLSLLLILLEKFKTANAIFRSQLLAGGLVKNKVFMGSTGKINFARVFYDNDAGFSNPAYEFYSIIPTRHGQAGASPVPPRVYLSLLLIRPPVR
jgi:hypothetical protein